MKFSEGPKQTKKSGASHAIVIFLNQFKLSSSFTFICLNSNNKYGSIFSILTLELTFLS